MIDAIIASPVVGAIVASLTNMAASAMAEFDALAPEGILTLFGHMQDAMQPLVAIALPVVGAIAANLANTAASVMDWFNALGPEGILTFFWDRHDTTQLLVVAGMMVFMVVLSAAIAVVGASPVHGVAGNAGKLARGAGVVLRGVFGFRRRRAHRPAPSRAPEVPTLEPALEQPPAKPRRVPRPRPAPKRTPSSGKAASGQAGAAKRKTSATKRKASAAKPKAAKSTPGNADELAVIEAEMMTLKELHTRGHISTEEYISESRALYDRARALR